MLKNFGTENFRTNADVVVVKTKKKMWKTPPSDQFVIPDSPNWFKGLPGFKDTRRELADVAPKQEGVGANYGGPGGWAALQLNEGKR